LAKGDGLWLNARMLSHPVLDQVLIGYSPVIDARRSMAATRLTIFPERPEAIDQGAALLEVVAEAFGLDEDAAAAASPPVLLNITSEALLDSVLSAAQRRPRSLVIEVPAFMAADGRRLALLQALGEVGQALAISGRPVAQLPREVLPLFSQAVVDFQDDRRTEVPPAVSPQRRIPTLSAGVRLSSEIDVAFQRGSTAVIGWPMDDEIPHAGGRGVPPEVSGIIELMNRVEREEPADRMEAVLTSDPTLAFRLLRYLNSSAFGLRSEVTSFQHALMLLGHQRLKRWLALLLASGTRNLAARPIMLMAARRGLFMEELARGLGDEGMRSEMFICGVFSLLDRLLRQPMAELMSSVPVQHRVQQSLIATGPYTQYLALVQAVEQASVYDIRDAAERVLVARTELNRALLRALSVARELD
jgi:c-di-GMP phosphodiesterase